MSAVKVAIFACTVGHKSHEPFFNVFLMEAGVMTFVTHCTSLVWRAHCTRRRRAAARPPVGGRDSVAEPSCRAEPPRRLASAAGTYRGQGRFQTNLTFIPSERNIPRTSDIFLRSPCFSIFRKFGRFIRLR